jgi:hypothetical protein
VQEGWAIVRKLARNFIKDHPLVAKLDHSMPLDDSDLAALARLLERKVIAKKAKDIIVEGYAYRVLHVVESGDIIGFPASFYEHAVFSVTAISEMSLHQVPLDDFAWKGPPSRQRWSGSRRARRPYTPSTSSTRDAASRSRGSPTFSWRC